LVEDVDAASLPELQESKNTAIRRTEYFICRW
jgi:hypothetical protein